MIVYIIAELYWWLADDGEEDFNTRAIAVYTSMDDAKIMVESNYNVLKWRGNGLDLMECIARQRLFYEVEVERTDNNTTEVHIIPVVLNEHTLKEVVL